MNQAKKDTKKKIQMVIPNHFEQVVDPMQSRLTSEEERVGYNLVIENELDR